jgi:hypothetical protein
MEKTIEDYNKSPEENKEVNVKIEKKAPTSPWKMGENATHLDRLRLRKKHKDFRPRWVRNDTGEIERARAEGWVIAQRKDYGIGKNYSEMGGTPGTNIVVGDLILMETPEQWAKEREAHIRNLTEKQTSDAGEQAEVHRAVSKGAVNITPKNEL